MFQKKQNKKKTDFLCVPLLATIWLVWILGGFGRCAERRDMNVNSWYCQRVSGSVSMNTFLPSRPITGPRSDSVQKY